MGVSACISLPAALGPLSDEGRAGVPAVVVAVLSSFGVTMNCPLMPASAGGGTAGAPCGSTKGAPAAVLMRIRRCATARDRLIEIDCRAFCVGLRKTRSADAGPSSETKSAATGEVDLRQLGWACLARSCDAQALLVPRHAVELRERADQTEWGREVET